MKNIYNIKFKIIMFCFIFTIFLSLFFNFSFARNVRNLVPFNKVKWVTAVDKSDNLGLKNNKYIFKLFPTEDENVILLPMQDPANLPEYPTIHNRVLRNFSTEAGKVIHVKGTGMKKFPPQHVYDLKIIRELIGEERSPSEALDKALMNGGIVAKDGEIIPLENLEKSGISCFTYYPNEEMPQQLWGGARKSVIKRTIETIRSIEKAYHQAKAQNDSFIQYLNEEHNITTLPIMEPVAVFKPKEIPIYVKQPQKFINRYNDKLTGSEKTKIKNNGKGTYNFKNGLEIAGIPKQIQEDYVIFVYSLPTGERISELKNYPLKKMRFGDVKKKDVHIKQWKNVLNHFGYEINFNYSNDVKKSPNLIIKKENKKIPFKIASSQIIKQVVLNLSLTIYVTHEVMGKSLGRLHDSGQYFGPFEPGNVDAAGWIADVINLRGEKNQPLDIEAVKDSVRKFSEALGIENEQKYLEFFEKLLNKSKER